MSVDSTLLNPTGVNSTDFSTALQLYRTGGLSDRDKNFGGVTPIFGIR